MWGRKCRVQRERYVMLRRLENIEKEKCNVRKRANASKFTVERAPSPFSIGL